MNAFLADLVTALHLAIVLFMLVGLVVVIVGRAFSWSWVREPWFRLTHLGITGYIVINALRGELCFLTHWEAGLRARAGQLQDEDVSFIGKLLREVLYVDLPQELLNRIYLVFGALVVLSLVWAPPDLSRVSPSDS